MLRRCHDLVGDGRIHQFCIRSGDREEFQFAARHTDMHKFDFTGLTELTGWLCQTDVPVYLTIDLDCLDPSAFPGTGTPEAGGVSFLQLLGAIRTVTKANIIGADVNELAPMLDQSGVSTATDVTKRRWAAIRISAKPLNDSHRSVIRSPSRLRTPHSPVSPVSLGREGAR